MTTLRWFQRCVGGEVNNASQPQSITSAMRRLFSVAIRLVFTIRVVWVVSGMLFGALGLAAAATGAGTEPGAGSPPQVVILNSYHPGEIWTDNELAGLLPVLQRVYPGWMPIVEYLDAKRFPGPDYLALLKDHLVRKYQHRRVDLLIALDNPAFDLALKYRHELFTGVPIVFAGINGFQPELLQGQDEITGVAETQDIEGTLKLALSLHPNTRQVWVIHDYTASGLAVRREIDAILPRYRDRLDITFSPDAPFTELERQLRALPADSVVLLPTYVTDREGRVLSREESTRLIAAASPAPVYAMHETRLGHGIVGGNLLDGQAHGAQAAALALRVLAGESPSRIPVENSHSHPQFDDRQLRRFQIEAAALPPGSTIINRPVSFYRQHQRLVLTTLAVLVFLVLIVIVLSLALRRVQRTEKAFRDSEERYRALFEHSRDAVLVADVGTGCIIDVNRAAEKLFERSRAALIGLHQTTLHPPGEAEKYAAAFNQGANGEAAYFAGEICPHADRRIPVEISTGLIQMPDGSFALQGFFRDITERKRAEKGLRASLEEKTALLKEVHHRVKNNLQIVASLLSLQARQVQNPVTLAALQDTQGRIRSMALLHESLYREGRFGWVDGAAYLSHLCAHLNSGFGLMTGRIGLSHHLAPIALTLDQAVPCGLIVNELVSNAFKHAFPDQRHGEIRVELQAEMDQHQALVVADDGVGLPPGLDYRQSDTLGLRLVAGLAQQLGARVETSTTVGTLFRFTFPAHSIDESPRP